jgi:hypothetical protein
MEIQFHSFVTWALNGFKGQNYACACSLSTRYLLKSGLCWSRPAVLFQTGCVGRDRLCQTGCVGPDRLCCSRPAVLFQTGFVGPDRLCWSRPAVLVQTGCAGPDRLCWSRPAVLVPQPVWTFWRRKIPRRKSNTGSSSKSLCLLGSHRGVRRS